MADLLEYMLSLFQGFSLIGKHEKFVLVDLNAEQYYSKLIAESFDFAPLDNNRTIELVRFISNRTLQLTVFSINLLASYHECRSLIGYVHYLQYSVLDSGKPSSVRLLTKWRRYLCVFEVSAKRI